MGGLCHFLVCNLKESTLNERNAPRIERHNLDGEGLREHEVYRVASRSEVDFWVSVTDIPCPVPGCANTVVWYEAGYVPGYRVCMARIGANSFDQDTIAHRFMAKGCAQDPKLVLAN